MLIFTQYLSVNRYAIRGFTRIYMYYEYDIYIVLSTCYLK